MNIRSITDYYAALNELAAMLQDNQITNEDWTIQSSLLHFLKGETP